MLVTLITYKGECRSFSVELAHLQTDTIFGTLAKVIYEEPGAWYKNPNALFSHFFSAFDHGDSL
jgi:hypothetical protein